MNRKYRTATPNIASSRSRGTLFRKLRRPSCTSMMSIPLLIVESGIETPIALLSDCILSRISSLDQVARTSVATLLYQVVSTVAPGNAVRMASKSAPRATNAARSGGDCSVTTPWLSGILGARNSSARFRQ